MFSECAVHKIVNANYAGAYTSFHSTQQGCVNWCIMNNRTCSAVDYNLRERRCFPHRAQTGAGHWQRDTCCNRFELICYRTYTIAVVSESPPESAQLVWRCTVFRRMRFVCGFSATLSFFSHYKHTMCRSMVDIQSATAEVRREKMKKEEKWKPQDTNIMACPI